MENEITLDALYCEQLYVLDRDYYDRRAEEGADTEALDAAHQARVTAMQACASVDELQELLATSWLT